LASPVIALLAFFKKLAACSGGKTFWVLLRFFSKILLGFFRKSSGICGVYCFWIRAFTKNFARFWRVSELSAALSQKTKRQAVRWVKDKFKLKGRGSSRDDNTGWASGHFPTYAPRSRASPHSHCRGAGFECDISRVEFYASGPW
jgi:hypothetical protein